MTEGSTEGLIQAACRVLRLLENTGSGRMFNSPAAVELREAITVAGGHYQTVAEEIEAERKAILDSFGGSR